MNIHKSLVKKKLFNATNFLWMQQAQNLLQQRKNFTQQFFIVAADMLILNQVNVRGKKHNKHNEQFYCCNMHTCYRDKYYNLYNSFSLWPQPCLIATNKMFVAIKTHQMQQMNFALQQAHELWQQKLSSGQHSFSMATGMPNRNQKNFRGNKHTSLATLNPNYRNAQLVVAIGTHKGNHLFHSGINTNLLQRMFQLTQPPFLVAIRSKYLNPLMCWFLQDQIMQPNVWCCEKNGALRVNS
jgi:hypothetical protein